MKKDIHLRIEIDTYYQIKKLAEFNKTTVNEEVNNLLQEALHIKDIEKLLIAIQESVGSIKKDSLYTKQLVVQTYADLNLEPIDPASSESLDKFNKKYHKRNMND